MTIDMVPYPEYKESGLPWLGKVPVHWNLRKLRSILKEITERNQPDLPLLSVVREKGVIVRDVTSKDENHNFIPDDLTNYKVVRKGQFAMNKMKAWQGSYGVSLYDGIVSPAYFVFEINEVGGNFFHAAIRSRAYVPFFTQASDGVRIGQWDLSKPRMREIPFAVPPSSEQDAIVSFLRGFDAKVRRFVRNRRRLIEVLNEQKQAIINRAVTRGLDPNAPHKPSGIEWMGEIPEQWGVVPLKRVTHLIAGGATPESSQAEYWNGDIVWVTPTDVSKHDVLTDSERRLTETGLASCSAVIVPAGTVVLTSRAPVGNTAIAAVPLCTNQGCKAIVPDTLRLDSEYLFAQINVMKPHLQNIATGTTFTEIDTWNVANQKVAVPPLQEQERIVAAIKRDTRSVEGTIRNAQREVDLIREYRTRLITDLVTGKLDVRRLRPDICDEPAEPANLDEDIDDRELLRDEKPELDEEAGD